VLGEHGESQIVSLHRKTLGFVVHF
jgi:hypothetical protein